MKRGTITASKAGAIFSSSKSDQNTLDTVIISSGKDDVPMDFGIMAEKKSTVALKDVHISQANNGVVANDHSTITISGGSFEAKNTTISAQDGATITLANNARIASSDGDGLHANGSETKITMAEGMVTGKTAALFAENGGQINVKNISATAEESGIKFKNSEKNTTSEINLTNSKFYVENGIGIDADGSTNTVNLSKKSEIHADVLLATKGSTEENNFTFTLNANDSVLEGRANIAQQKNVLFDLKNGTKWILKTSTKEKDADGNLLDIAQRSRSDISVLNINDSSLVFAEPTEGHYHTLHIGSGKPDTKAVYNASGNAEIYFNTAWSDGTPVADQKTDRLIIHGDVKGSTTVYIKSDAGDKNSVLNASGPSNVGGFSLIQVSGHADENSFKLTHGYTTINGLPYKYTLTGYGPESSYDQANVEQSLFDEKNENFWDFRLHKIFLDPESKVEALVPQAANYLLMPNALFYAGLTDMVQQNALLVNMRTSVLGKQQEQQNSFFLNTYGGTRTLSSESAPLKYGYSGAHLRYAALQGGMNFAALKGQNTITHFGLVGTYGQLSFTPKNMQDAAKTTVDKWSLTAYASIQHDNGFYLDPLVSYGILKGDISNAIIGKTAKLKNAKMLNISTTVGKQFATGIASVTFEPQAQIAYQHLMFDTISDADNLTIDMNNPHQWLIRFGGRLNKTVVTAENRRAVSFYGKVNVIKTFGDDQAIHIGKDYQTDPMGSLLEGGLGISAQMSQNVSLHGDVTYQQKLQKTGISGASFSGGIRYQF
nr:autotransporter outer membrane beta-barrel domain-containing protein [Bartonella phoceensis]